MSLPPHNDSYKDREYWDQRYKNENSFDWCKSYESFRDLILKYVKTNEKILMLGCGNSNLSEEMYKDGFTHITNIDYSSVVIAKMAKQCSCYPDMEWVVMDITQMTFGDETFDVIIEKATLDVLLVREKDPWNVSEETSNKFDTVLCKISQILRKNGRFISVSFAQPHFRKLLYAKPEYNWSLHYETFGDTFHFFFYIMVKGEKLSEEDQIQYFSNVEDLDSSDIPSSHALDNYLETLHIDD